MAPLLWPRDQGGERWSAAGRPTGAQEARQEALRRSLEAARRPTDLFNGLRSACDAAGGAGDNVEASKRSQEALSLRARSDEAQHLGAHVSGPVGDSRVREEACARLDDVEGVVELVTRGVIHAGQRQDSSLGEVKRHLPHLIGAEAEAEEGDVCRDGLENAIDAAVRDVRGHAGWRRMGSCASMCLETQERGNT